MYCDGLDRKKFTPVVAINSQQVIRDLDTVIGAETPRIVTTDTAAILRFAQKHAVKVVYTWYDGQFHEDLHQLLFGLKQQGAKILTNNVFSYYDERMDALSDRVIFQTYMMLETKFKGNFPVQKKFDYLKYRQLYNPVNVVYLSQFRLSEKDRNAVRAKYGYSETDVIVGRFGRNDIVKFGDQLLAAIFSFRNHPKIKFFITGMPRSRRYLIRCAQVVLPSLRKICVILPPTADDAELMRRMQIVDIIAHSVRIGEGCSNAINEAMFWGKPVITNSTPHCDNGQVEQVDDLKTGRVTHSTREFLTAISTLAQSKTARIQLGTQGKVKATTQYAAKQVVHQFTALVREMYDTNEKNNRIERVKNKTQCAEFRKWYKFFLVTSSAQPEKKFTLSHSVSVLVRALNYIEYKYFNG